MKRVMLENWPNLDKLCLVSAITKTGAQNWNAVSRMTRTIYENVAKLHADCEKRSAEWFSMKQCAAQYENMLKNVSSRRKNKRNDRSSSGGGVQDASENPLETVLQYYRQECIDELVKSAVETKAQYMKIYKEHKELVVAGRQSHKLPDMLEEIEAKERDKEIKKKLKLKLGEKNAESEISAKLLEEKHTPEKDSSRTPVSLVLDSAPPPVIEPPKTPTTTSSIPSLTPTTPTSSAPKPIVTTSPLLTSLLQSPSPISRPPVPSSAAPTISLLLNSSPSVPASSDSPTLSKLLESPACPFQPSPSNVPSTNLSTLPVDSAPVLPVDKPKDEEELDQILEDAERMLEERKEQLQLENPVEVPQPPSTPETVLESILQDVVESEVVIEHETMVASEKKVEEMVVEEEVVVAEEFSTPALTSKPSPPKQAPAEFEQSVLETVEEIIDKVEEAVVEVASGDVGISDVAMEVKMNQTNESETPEDDQLDSLELDQNAVELIVVGPTPCPVVTIRDDGEFEETNKKPVEVKVEASRVDEAKPEDVKEEEIVEIEEKTSLDVDSSSRTSTPEAPKLSPEPQQPSTVESVVLIDDDTESTRESDSIEKKPEVTEVIISEDVSEQSAPGKEVDDKQKVKKEVEVIEVDDEEQDEADRESTGTAQSEQTRPATASPPLPPVIKELQRGERLLQSSSSQDDSSNDAASLIEIKSVKSEETEKDAASTTGGEESQSETERKDPSSGRRRASRRFAFIDNSAERRFSRRTAGKENKTKDASDQPTAETKDQEKRSSSRKRNTASSSDSVPRSISPTSSIEDDKEYRSWKKTILLNFDTLAAHKFASVFLRPITEAEAAGYHEMVKRPMDLTTIKRNIENGTIRTTVEFQRDMLIMVQNAIMYNESDSLIFKMAQEMLTDFREKMGTMVQALGHGVPLSVEEESKPSPRARVSKIQLEEPLAKKKRMSVGSAEDALRSSKRKRTDGP